VPAYTVVQPKEGAQVLDSRAKELKVLSPTGSMLGNASELYPVILLHHRPIEP
jgi:predicted MPP superfamily phosphohydrolase